MNTAAGMTVRTYVTFRVSLEVMEKQAEEEGESLVLPFFCLWALILHSHHQVAAVFSPGFSL